MDTITEAPTYQATIYCGLRESYDGLTRLPGYAKKICQEYVDGVGLCVSFIETVFIYNGGSEPGIIVGLINYPRFPADPELIQEKAMVLAAMLRDAFKQKRVTVVCTDKTFMLGEIE